MTFRSVSIPASDFQLTSPPATAEGFEMPDLDLSKPNPTETQTRLISASHPEGVSDKTGPPPAPALPPDNVHSFCLTGLFVLAVFFTLNLARVLFMPVVVAILFFFVLSPVVRFLKKVGIKESIGAGLLVALLAGLAGYAIYSLAVPAADWLENAPANLRKLESKLSVLKGPMEKMKDATGKVEDLAIGSDKSRAPEVAIRNESGLVIFLSKGWDIVEQTLVVVVLLYFLLASGDMFLRKIIRVLPRVEDKIKAIELARDIEKEIGHYLLTISSINAGLGLLTTLALHLLGMPTPGLWGFMVGMLAFIPYLGATISFSVLTCVALLTFDSPGRAMWVPGVFLAIDLIVEQFLNPYIIGRRMALNPVMIFAGLMFWGWMWGIVGALAAVPIIVVIKIFCDHIERYRAMGEFLGDEQKS